VTAANAAWGGAVLTVTVSSVDVSCDVIECVVDRSKNRLWDPPDAGTCQLILDLTENGQPPSRGPVGAIVRVHVAYGVTGRYLFTGTVQRRRLVMSPTQGDTLILDCVDEFELLSRVNRRADPASDSPVGGGDTVPERLERWLDEASSSSTRAIDPSDYTCPEVLIDGNVLRQLQATALADGGDFFVNGAGVVTFLGLAWRNEVDVVSAVFSDRLAADWVPYTSAAYHDDLDEVQNQVTGTRRAIDGEPTPPVPQTVQNSSSMSTYGARGDPLDDLELEDDGQVATRVAQLIAVAAGPNPRFDSIIVQPAFKPSRMWPRVIPVTFGSLIAANRLWEDGTEHALYGHVIGERWTITPTDATVEYRSTGTATWDGTRGPRAPLALESCPDGTLRVPPGYPCDMTSDVIIKDADGNVLATYPPGSLCECGVVEVPDGGVELCLDDGEIQVCVPIDDPRLDALLWFDVLDPGPDLIERIDRDAVDPGAGYAGSTLNAIPGDFDAMNATDAGGLIGAENASRLGAADLGDGWTVDFWLYLADDLAATSNVTIIDLGPVKVRLSTEYDPATMVEVYVSALDAVHLAPVASVTLDTWQHWEIRYSPGADALIVRVDGAIVYADAFPYPPTDPAGDWGVSLPGGARIGEVIVYGDRPLLGDYDETVIADGPYAYWRLNEEFPVTGSGYDDTVGADGPYAYWRLNEETP
jgi:hypothetical protein